MNSSDYYQIGGLALSGPRWDYSIKDSSMRQVPSVRTWGSTVPGRAGLIVNPAMDAPDCPEMTVQLTIRGADSTGALLPSADARRTSVHKDIDTWMGVLGSPGSLIPLGSRDPSGQTWVATGRLTQAMSPKWLSWGAAQLSFTIQVTSGYWTLAERTTTLPPNASSVQVAGATAIARDVQITFASGTNPSIQCPNGGWTGVFNGTANNLVISGGSYGWSVTNNGVSCPQLWTSSAPGVMCFKPDTTAAVPTYRFVCSNSAKITWKPARI